MSDSCVFVISKKQQGEKMLRFVFFGPKGCFTGLCNLKKYNTIEVGSLVKILSQKPFVNLEISRNYFSIMMSEIKKLYLIKSIFTLINSVQGLLDQKIYFYLLSYFEKIIKKKFDPIDYLEFEMFMLASLGYGLDLSKCCLYDSYILAQDFDNLKYISPKTGRAGSEKAGEGFHDQLFLFPLPLKLAQMQLMNFELSPKQKKLEYTKLELQQSMNILGFFLKKFLDVENPYRNNLYP